ncbi:MAG TPA: ribonuclease E inhibitor RraB [Candidatus Sulfotelmatobacter sp.]|nr:ribonuclease E inhibitor RraB [Candidatus Sulfotelmatobacter sp.]
MTISIVLVVVIVAAIAIAWVAVRREHVPARPERATTTVVPNETSADAQILEQLRLAGADLTKPTELRYYLYVPTRAQAEQAAAELVARGYTPELRAPRGLRPDGKVDTEWAVIAVETHVPSPEHVGASRILFHRLATTFGGVYDGWEAAVSP